MQKSRYVIYGASSGGKKVCQTLRNMGIEIEFFVDSNEKKWGETLENKKISSPLSIQKDRHKIIIASELNQDAIENYLETLGLKDNIIMKEEIMIPYLKRNYDLTEIKSDIEEDNKKRKVFIELLEGTPEGAGGIAEWSVELAQILRTISNESYIVSSGKYKFPLNKEDLFWLFETDYATYWEDVSRLIRFFENNLPCTIILNKQMQMLYAAIVLKSRYPKQVKVISVNHSDSICLYKRCQLIYQYIDCIYAITEYMKNKLINLYNIPDYKIICRLMPVPQPYIGKHKYLSSKKNIDIAYVGRITREQKRSDLIIDLINNLEEKNVHYKLHIAGTGDYESAIKEYVKKKQLETKIILYGMIPKEKIFKFWEDKDVAICVSDVEGTCLSILEAMAAGAVPVCTNVLCADEFVKTPDNGYVVEKGDMVDMAGKIKYLEMNRDLIVEKGKKSQKFIAENCSEESYKDFLMKAVYE